MDISWIAQAMKNQNDQASDIWSGLAKTGEYLSNTAMKKQALEQEQQYKQAQLAMEQQKLAADKEHRERSYQLDYQKTMQGAKANQLKDAIAMQRLQLDLKKDNRAEWDFNDKVQRDTYLKNNADKYAKAVVNKDLSVLSKEDLAALPAKDQLSLYKTIAGSSQDLINREKSRIFDAIGDNYVQMIDGINVDPKDGSTNATEMYKDFLKNKVQPMINSGMYDRKAIAEVTNYVSSMVSKTASMKKGSIQNTMAPDIVTEYNPLTEADFTDGDQSDDTPYDVAAQGAAFELGKGLEKRGESYTLDTPENIQRYQDSLFFNKKVALQDRGKGGVLNSVKLQGGTAKGKKKDEMSDGEKQLMDALSKIK